MSNRFTPFIEFKGVGSTLSHTLANPINGCGEVRISALYIPHVFAFTAARTGQPTRDSISLSAETITYVSALLPSNLQDGTSLSNEISCRFRKEATGFSEDIIAGYDPATQTFILKSATFAASDIHRRYPIDGTMPFIINNTDLMWELAGYTAAALTPAVVHQSVGPDQLFKYERLYLTSPELTALSSTLVELEAPPADTAFLVPVDQNATAKRVTNTWFGGLRVFYQNTVEPIGVAFPATTVLTLSLRYANGDLVDMRGVEWSVLLAFEPAVFQPTV